MAIKNEKINTWMLGVLTTIILGIGTWIISTQNRIENKIDTATVGLATIKEQSQTNKERLDMMQNYLFKPSAKNSKNSLPSMPIDNTYYAILTPKTNIENDQP